MAKKPIVHPVYGPRLTHRKRHNYRPLSDEERTEDRYPTYSFVVDEGKFSEDIREQLFEAQIEDENFTYAEFTIRNKRTLFRVKMHDKMSDSLKKILFKVGLKVQSGITTR